MPIKPENLALYPPDWPQIRARILNRDGHHCKWCGLSNHAWGWRDSDGAFRSVTRGPLRDAGYNRPPFFVATSDLEVIKVIEIILTIAHLDHDPTNCAGENLAALCQQCHNRYDRKHRNGTRRRRSELGQLLFTGGTG